MIARVTGMATTITVAIVIAILGRGSADEVTSDPKSKENLLRHRAVSMNWAGVLSVGVLIIRALLWGLYHGA